MKRMRAALMLPALGLIVAMLAALFVAPSASAEMNRDMNRPLVSALATALERCQAGQPPNRSYPSALTGTAQQTVVGGPTDFWPGDVYRVDAAGSIRTSLLPWDVYNANGRVGDPAPSDPAWPAPGLNKFSLVGDIVAGGGMVQLGTQTACIDVPWRLPKSQLRVWINDNIIGDNSGGWSITVRQWYV